MKWGGGTPTSNEMRPPHPQERLPPSFSYPPPPFLRELTTETDPLPPLAERGQLEDIFDIFSSLPFLGKADTPHPIKSGDPPDPHQEVVSTRTPFPLFGAVGVGIPPFGWADDDGGKREVRIRVLARLYGVIVI